MNVDDKYEYERCLKLSGFYSRDDLRHAYRRAAKIYHPDIARFHGIPVNLAEENMKRANDAYMELEKLFSEWPYPEAIESDYNPEGDQIEDGFFVFDDEVFLGAILQLGRYPTRSDNSFMPLDWYVIEVEEDSATLITDRCIDCRPYHSRRGPVTWATSDIRTWLNSIFFERAFNSDEASVILNTTLTNSKYNRYGIHGGKDTIDKVFLLNVDESSEFFADWRDLASTITEFAEKRGAYCDSEKRGVWWLRSPGRVEDSVSYIAADGYIHNYDGRMALADNYSVRPAIRIRLKRRYRNKLDRETERARNKAAAEKRRAEQRAREQEAHDAAANKAHLAAEQRRAAEQRAREDGYTPIPNDVVIGANIEFGHYPEGSALNWRVIDINDNSVLLVSETCIARQPFAYDAKTSNWKDSLVRAWLNDDFIYQAFSDVERSAIERTNLIDQEQDCHDRLFCLSKSEAEHCFANEHDRVAFDLSNLSEEAQTDSSPASWWLRTPGTFGDSFICTVLGMGKILGMGLSCSDIGVSIRPAMWIRR